MTAKVAQRLPTRRGPRRPWVSGFRHRNLLTCRYATAGAAFTYMVLAVLPTSVRVRVRADWRCLFGFRHVRTHHLNMSRVIGCTLELLFTFLIALRLPSRWMWLLFLARRATRSLCANSPIDNTGRRPPGGRTCVGSGELGLNLASLHRFRHELVKQCPHMRVAGPVHASFCACVRRSHADLQRRQVRYRVCFGCAHPRLTARMRR